MINQSLKGTAGLHFFKKKFTRIQIFSLSFFQVTTAILGVGKTSVIPIQAPKYEILLQIPMEEESWQQKKIKG